MKFLIFSPEIHARLSTSSAQKSVAGGAEQQLLLLGEDLIKRGHQVTFCSYCPDGFVARAPYHVVAISKSSSSLKKYLVFLGTLYKENPDMIIQRPVSNFLLPIILYKTLFRAKAILFSANDFDFSPRNSLNSTFSIIKKLCLPLTDFLFVQNETQRQHLWNFVKRKGHLFLNIITDLPSEIPTTLRDYYLWVGRFSNVKQPEKLIELAEKYPQEKFMMLAPLPEVVSPSLQLLLNRAQCLPNLTLNTEASRDSLPAIYAGAKGLINTSLSEGFPNTFLEAWQVGTPVFTLGFDIDGLIKKSNGTMGWVFKDIDDFATLSLKVSLADSDTMTTYVTKNHSLSENTTRFLQILKKGKP